MLPIRSTIVFITSLGLAGSAIAAPIATDLNHPELLAGTMQDVFDQIPVDPVADIDLFSINLSYGIQDRSNDLNFLKSETVKTNVKPIRVPEPSSLLMLALGLIGLTVLRRRKD